MRPYHEAQPGDVPTSQHDGKDSIVSSLRPQTGAGSPSAGANQQPPWARAGRTWQFASCPQETQRRRRVRVRPTTKPPLLSTGAGLANHSGAALQSSVTEEWHRGIKQPQLLRTPEWRCIALNRAWQHAGSIRKNDGQVKNSSTTQHRAAPRSAVE
ncbi:hypothetical protein P154DRAFT_524853 [Amniculicola lignicola CBS 123094]|uniref:Uncharacterized protein n=1 Tax=Amniculicola lignicola CBS 123094 TaxID=1392246 RepID=A0A6A5WI69_9PLEO|nr:hypothetical protein P154DRAFT_524853 [Amniculicola lignicola CBS 123094]